MGSAALVAQRQVTTLPSSSTQNHFTEERSTELQLKSCKQLSSSHFFPSLNANSFNKTVKGVKCWSSNTQKKLSSWLPVMELAILEHKFVRGSCTGLCPTLSCLKTSSTNSQRELCSPELAKVSPSLPFPQIKILQQALGYCSQCVSYSSAAKFTYFYLWFGGFWINPVHKPNTENSVEIPIVFGDVLGCQQVNADKMRLNLVLNHWHIDRCHLKTAVLFPTSLGKKWTAKSF